MRSAWRSNLQDVWPANETTYSSQRAICKRTETTLQTDMACFIGIKPEAKNTHPRTGNKPSTTKRCMVTLYTGRLALCADSPLGTLSEQNASMHVDRMHFPGHLQYALKRKLGIGMTHATNELDSTTQGCIVHVGYHSNPEQAKLFSSIHRATEDFYRLKYLIWSRSVCEASAKCRAYSGLLGGFPNYSSSTDEAQARRTRERPRREGTPELFGRSGPPTK